MPRASRKTSEAKPARADKDNPSLAEVQDRAKELGCYMQLFIAYNPKTEMLLVASNAPDADNDQEAGLLLALAGEQVSARLEAALRASGINVIVEGDDPPDTLN